MLRSDAATANLNAAVGKFLKALERYQSATKNINQAALRMNTQNLTLCREVDVVVRAAAPFITSGRNRN